MALDPDGYIGAILLDQEEADVARPVAAAINRLLDNHIGAKDAEYIATPE